MPTPRLLRLLAIAILVIASLAIGVSALARVHNGAKRHVSHHVMRAHHRVHHRPDIHRVTRNARSPAVSWTTPESGWKVSGQLDERAHNCVVSASSTVGIDHVSFYRNGTLLNTERYRPYSCVWDTTKVTDGSSYTLRAVASDEHGNSASASVKVRVRNAPGPDITAPQTTITAGPSGTSGSSSASFSFSSSEAGSSFQCSLDAGSWASCSSPKAYSGLADGNHSFEVRATDRAGNTDPTPADREFTVDTGPPGSDGYPAIQPPYTFVGGFDAGGCERTVYPGGWAVDESGTDYPGVTTIETQTVGQDGCAARYETPAFSSDGRALLQMPTMPTPSTWDIEALTYIPSPANNGLSGINVYDLIGNRQNGNSCGDGGLMLRLRQGSSGVNHLYWETVGDCSNSVFNDLGPMILDRWFAVRAQVRYADDGFLKVWLDPDGPGPAGYTLKVDQAHVDTLVGYDVKLRQGLYHTNDLLVPHEVHVFGDGFRAVCRAGC
jgi:hypothetical protein